MTFRNLIVVFLLLLCTTQLAFAQDDLGSLVNDYLSRPYSDLAEDIYSKEALYKRLTESRNLLPYLTKRLKIENFDLEVIYGPSHFKTKYSARLLGELAGRDFKRQAIIELVKPMLTSTNANERGWSNYILTGPISFKGELDNVSCLLAEESSEQVRAAILARAYYSLSNNPEIRPLKDKDSAWRDELVDAIDGCFDSADELTKKVIERCLREIRSPASTEVAVRRVVARDPNFYCYMDLLRDRLGSPKQPDAINQAQMESMAGPLIEFNPQKFGLISDVLMNLRDKRVLPAYFDILNNDKEAPDRAVYGIWIIISRDMESELPSGIRQLPEVNRDVPEAMRLLQEWYKENRHRLDWDDVQKKYRLK